MSLENVFVKYYILRRVTEAGWSQVIHTFLPSKDILTVQKEVHPVAVPPPLTNTYTPCEFDWKVTSLVANHIFNCICLLDFILHNSFMLSICLSLC